MRKLKLLLAVCTLLVGGANSVKAYTVSDLTSAGWTQVTSSSITGVSDNYYVLVDAHSSNYVMSCDPTHFRPCYKTINDPVANPSFVWILAGSDNKFTMQSAATGAFFNQVSGWNTSVGYPRDDGRANVTGQFTLNDGKYTLKCVESNGLVGHWNDSGAAVAEDGENIAANKAEKDAPGFYLYSIPRAEYIAALVAARKPGVAIATKASPADVTSYIQNADWSGDWGGWAGSLTSVGNMQWIKQKTIESWTANNVVLKQDLVGLPNGLYKFTADVISGNNDNKTAYVYAVGDETVNGEVVSAVASAGDYATMSSEVAGKTLTADNVFVTNNAITVGLNQPSGWVVADNFKLYYYGPIVMCEAIDLPANGAMAANQWYKYTVLYDGSYTIAATTAANIVSTTTGNVLVEEATTSAIETGDDVELTAGTTIYYKSSSDNTLTIEANIKTYSVGGVTATSIVANSYLQSITTVTFTLGDATTDDGDAVLALQGTPTAILSKGGSTVAEGALSISGNVVTATFSSVTLVEGSTYTVTLPANAVAYSTNNENKNTEGSVSFKTPQKFDGTYFLSTVVSEKTKYLSRMSDNNASVDNFGLAFNLITDADGITYFQFLENTSYYLDDNNNYAVATKAKRGANTNKWILDAVEGGFKVRLQVNTNCELTVANTETGKVEITRNAQTGYVWNFLTAAEHATAMQAWVDAQAAAAATAAGISVSTKDALETLISDATNFASKSIELTGDYNVTSVQDKFQAGGDLFAAKTLTGLANGLYKLSVYAYQRISDNPTTYAAYQKGFIGTEYLEANGQQTRIKSVMDVRATTPWVSGNDYNVDGGYYPNNTTGALNAFNAGNYKNDVYVYVSDGTLTYKLYNPSNPQSANWTPYYSFSLTYYTDEVDTDDASSIISDAEALVGADMEGVVQTALIAKLDAFKADKTIPKYNDLSAAIDAANASKTAYANTVDYFTRLEALMATTNFYSAAAKAAVYDTPKAQYEAKTLVTAEAPVYQAYSYSPESDRYLKNTAGELLMPGWTINGNDATQNGSGFYQNTWSTEDDFGLPFYELWTGSTSLAATTVVGTLAGLTPNGSYMITALVRVQGNDKVANSVTMKVGEGTAVDVTAGDKIGTTNRYKKEFTAMGTADASGNLVLTFDVAANSNVSWVSFKNVNYVALATAAEKDALATAISTAKAKTLGFEAGDYAPYNNIAAIQTLAAADAVNLETATSAEVVAATNALTAATWTANVTEMNAFYKGDFADYAEDNATPLDYTPNGWTPSNNFRLMLANAETYPGLSDATAGRAVMSWSGGITYGEQAGYEMPLASHTIYELSFKEAGWASETLGNLTVSVKKGGEGLVNYNLGKADKHISGGLTTFSIKFVTGEAGNYVFSISSPNNMVLTDFKLLQSELIFADNAAVPTYAPGTYPVVKISRTLTAERWATAVYPFAVSGVDNIAVLNSYDKETGALGFATAAESTANQPFLMRSNTAKSELSLANVAVEAVVGSPSVTKSEAQLIGTYTTTDITNAEKNYVLSSNKIYSVGEAGATINPYRAYIQIEQEATARALSFVIDGQEATGIEAVSIDGSDGNNVYNLNGQRIVSPKKGLYIRNGKKVVVK